MFTSNKKKQSYCSLSKTVRNASFDSPMSFLMAAIALYQMTNAIDIMLFFLFWLKKSICTYKSRSSGNSLAL